MAISSQSYAYFTFLQLFLGVLVCLATYAVLTGGWGVIFCLFKMYDCIIRSLLVTLIALALTKALKVNPIWAHVMEATGIAIYHKKIEREKRERDK